MRGEERRSNRSAKGIEWNQVRSESNSTRLNPPNPPGSKAHAPTAKNDGTGTRHTSSVSGELDKKTKKKMAETTGSSRQVRTLEEQVWRR